VTQEITELLNSGYRYANSLTHHSAKAEDILQDAWVAVLHADGPKTKAYLFSAIRSRFINQYRRDQLVPIIPIDEMDNDHAAYDEKYFDHLEYAQLEKALESLRSLEREALFLAVVEGYTAEEISKLTDQPRGSVLSLLHRAKKKLRTHLTNLDKEALA